MRVSSSIPTNWLAAPLGSAAQGYRLRPFLAGWREHWRSVAIQINVKFAIIDARLRGATRPALQCWSWRFRLCAAVDETAIERIAVDAKTQIARCIFCVHDITVILCIINFYPG